MSAPGASAGDATVQTIRATEIINAAEAVWTTDDDGIPMAEVVIVRPGLSTNRRFYSKEAIEQAVRRGFWNGSKMFVDHPTDLRMPRKRQLRDLVSGITETFLGNEGEARGKVKFFNPDFAKFAERARDYMGVSIVHESRGRISRDREGKRTEQIDEFLIPHSVDWVAFPAAGGGIAQFLQAAESEDDVEWSDLTEDMLRQHRPDLVTALGAAAEQDNDDEEEEEEEEEGKPTDEQPTPQAQPKPKTEAEQPAPAQNTVSVEEVRRIVAAEVEAKQREWEDQRSREAEVRAKIQAQVARSGLPAKTQARISASFDGQTEYDEKVVAESIDDALAELREAGFRGPQPSGLGTSGKSDTPPTPEELAKEFPTMAAFESEMGYTRGEQQKGAN